MTFESIGDLSSGIVNRLAGVTVIQPANRAEWLAARKQDVTASVAGCLLGIHPYTTAYGLWAEKTGRIAADIEDSPALRRGRLLEPVAIQMIREDRPDWTVTYHNDNAYYRDSAARLGATPDAFATRPDKPGRGIVQVKTASDYAYKQNWRDPETGQVTPPLWVAVQATVEAHLTGSAWAAVAVMVVGRGIELHIIDIPLLPALVKRIRAEVDAFWHTVASGQKPDVDWKRDGALLETLFDPSVEIISLEADNALPALLDEREGLSSARSAAEKRLKEIKAELLAKLGDASAGRIADGRMVTAKRVERAGYEVKPTSYVDVRIRKAAA